MLVLLCYVPTMLHGCAQPTLSRRATFSPATFSYGARSGPRMNVEEPEEVAAAASEEAPAASEEPKLSAIQRMRLESGGASGEDGLKIKPENVLPGSAGLVNIGLFLAVAAAAAFKLPGLLAQADV
jgi:hypothetical protein